MEAEPSTDRFDCVGYMRNVRDRISGEIATMDHGELSRWLHAHPYSDPILRRLANLLRPQERQDGEAGSTPVDR